MKPVLIVWDDAQSSNGMDWERTDCERLTAARVHTAGFLVAESEAGVEVIMSYHEDEMCGRWYIPRACIVSMFVLCHSHRHVMGE